MSIKKNILFNTLLSVSQILFPLITFPYAARILGPKSIGQMSFVDSISQYFILFCALGIPLYAVREISKLKGDTSRSDKLFSELFLLHLFVSLFGIIIYALIYFFISKHQLHLDLYLIGGGLIFVNVFVIDWYFQAQEKFSFIAIRSISIRLLFIVLMFFFVKTEDDLINYYSLFFLLQLVNAIANFTSLYRSGFKMKFSNLKFKIHFRPLMFLTACSVIGSVYVLLDNVLLGLLGNYESVGFYSSAIKITKIPISLISALGIVLVPKISQSFRDGDSETVKFYLKKSIDYVITLAIPLSIGIALCANWAVVIVSGKSFIPATELVRYLSPIIFLIALNSLFFFQLFTPSGQERIMIIILSCSAFLSISMNVILIPLLNHVGAAITTTMTELSVFLISLWYAKQKYSITFDLGVCVAPLISSLIFVPIYFMIDITDLLPLFKLGICGLLCIVSYYLIQRFLFMNEIVIVIESYILSILKIKRND